MECSVFRLITCSLYIGEQLCSTVNGFIVFLKEIPGVALMIFCKTKRQCSGRSVGAPGMHPPTARNVFIFVPFFSETFTKLYVSPLEVRRPLL